VPLAGSEIVDESGGLADLRDGALRMTSPEVFAADPLRLLRAARLASELGFGVERATAAEVRRRAEQVRESAAERRRDELMRIFSLEDASAGVRLLDDLRLLGALLPEVTLGKGVDQPPQWHAYDVFEHNVRCVEAMDIMLARKRPTSERAWMWDGLWSVFAWCERHIRDYLADEMSEGRTRSSLLKVAALLHDVAKPLTRTVDDDGGVRFYGHADEGATIAQRIMRRLRFSAHEVRFVSRLVAEHLRPVQLAQVGEVPTRRALYRFYRSLDDAMPGVLLLALADAAASRGEAMTSGGWSRHVAYMNSLLVRSSQEPGIVNPPRLLTGDDVMRELGLPAGPAIGELLEALREAQAAGDVRNAEEARAFIRGRATEAAADAGEG
jgi:poly(A) polymerase